jgi:hypothetical protein
VLGTLVLGTLVLGTLVLDTLGNQVQSLISLKGGAVLPLRNFYRSYTA